MEDVIFNCPNCEQELAVDASGVGSEIQCPACNETIIIPEGDPEGQSDGEKGENSPDGEVQNVIRTSAAAKEEKHFQVPQHNDDTPEKLIEKPLPPLDKAAKEGITLQIKTIKRSDCVEVGKDQFDEVVTQFLSDIGEDKIVSINPITYSHQDLASHTWITDFGVMVVFKS